MTSPYYGAIVDDEPLTIRATRRRRFAAASHIKTRFIFLERDQQTKRSFSRRLEIYTKSFAENARESWRRLQQNLAQLRNLLSYF